MAQCVSELPSYRPPAPSRVWRGMLVLAALTLAASAARAQETRARISLPGWRAPFPIEDVVIDVSLDAPSGKAFTAIAGAFDDLKIPVDTRDSVAGLIGSMRILPSGSLGGLRLSRILDCGQGPTGAPNAESYRLTVVLLVLLDPIDASHTKVRIGLVASGQEPGGSNRIQCGSSGRMEEVLQQTAAKRLSK